MDKSKKIITIVVIVISIILIGGISWYLLDTTGKINQGNFRINDILITSSVEVKEQEVPKQEGEQQPALTLSQIPFQLSQTNKIELLIPKDVEAKRIYLDDISISSPSKKGETVLTLNGKDRVDLNAETKEVDIYPAEKENQYYLEVQVDNVDFAKDVKVPEDTQSITYDGSILKLVGIKAEELEMEIKFNLNIVDITGKKNVCSMKFKFPTEEMIKNGISVTREEPTRYIFSVK